MMSPLPSQRSILDRVIDLSEALAAHCRMVDPEQALGLSQPAMQILGHLQQFAVRHEAELRTGQTQRISEPERLVLKLALLNMMLLEALCARAEAQQRQESALPADVADAMAHLLVSVGILTQEMYAFRGLTNIAALKPYFTEAVKASLHIGPLSEAFAAAMKGDQAAANEALRIFDEFLTAAQSGKVMPPPWELEGGALS